MHRSFCKTTDKSQGQQVQETVDEPFPSEFCNAIFSWTVFDYFFTDVSEAGIFGQNRYVAVHFAVHLDTFYHLLSVGLQATIEIMQVDT